MKKQKAQLGFHLLLLIVFVALAVFFTVKYGPGIIKIIRKPDHFRDFLASYKSISILVFMFFQVLQVVISPIPGEFVQIAGGYVYGTFLGTVYSTTGILIGAIIAFYIARLVGFRLVKDLVSEQSIEKLNFLVNNPKSEITMFILFLIPGIPKDILVYLAGLTPIKPLNFFIIFIIARFPIILASSFVGSNIQERDYLPVAIVAGITGALFVLGLIYKDKVIHILHKFLPSQKDS
jgi:uncharacterized membrane protein YdjX (TVP38/TMEM64 family)